jgi:hypothetical protein
VADLLDNLEDLARSTPVDQLPGFLGKLESAKAVAFSRLVTPQSAAQSDELITVEVGAAQIGMSAEWIYRNARTLPFIRRVGRSVRCSKVGIEAYIRRAR